MSLISIFQKNPAEVSNFRVDQIVTLAGDGKLRDGSACSTEFREYLNGVGLEKLAGYVQEVLGNKLPDGGFVLQDLINEIGRRLGFSVENGRYHGVTGRSGHDGYWQNDRMQIVVEVKTTDAYRINLSTLASYAKKIHEESDHKRFCILLVVGRQDTGDLEAQIRGSKFAWDVRVISAESLLDLSRLYAVAVDLETSLALQHALLPVEYTRVDHLVDLLSRLAFDVERSVTLEEDRSDISQPKLVEQQPVSEIDHNEQRTVEEVKAKILQSLVGKFSFGITAQSRSKYESIDNKYAFFVTVSKNYARADQQYWYALQAKWVDRLNKKDAYLCLGMIDKPYFFLMPGEIATGLPQFLNKTEKPGSLYWHIALCEEKQKTYMLLPKKAARIDLEPFKVNLNV